MKNLAFIINNSAANVTLEKAVYNAMMYASDDAEFISLQHSIANEFNVDVELVLQATDDWHSIGVATSYADEDEDEDNTELTDEQREFVDKAVACFYMIEDALLHIESKRKADFDVVLDAYLSKKGLSRAAYAYVQRSYWLWHGNKARYDTAKYLAMFEEFEINEKLDSYIKAAGLLAGAAYTAAEHYDEAINRAQRHAELGILTAKQLEVVKGFALFRKAECGRGLKN